MDRSRSPLCPVSRNPVERPSALGWAVRDLPAKGGRAGGTFCILLVRHDPHAKGKGASVAVASDAPFSGWGSTFTDPRLAAAVVEGAVGPDRVDIPIRGRRLRRAPPAVFACGPAATVADRTHHRRPPCGETPVHPCGNRHSAGSPGSSRAVLSTRGQRVVLLN